MEIGNHGFVLVRSLIGALFSVIDEVGIPAKLAGEELFREMKKPDREWRAIHGL